MFYSENQLITTNIARALESVYLFCASTSQTYQNRLIDSGGDWDRRNRLKVYRALHHLSVREFKEATELLIDSLSTFTATEVMEYETFVGLTVLAAGVGCDRKGIKSKARVSLYLDCIL